MRNLFLTLAMALVAMTSFAFDVEVDGIYYNLNKTEKTAVCEFVIFYVAILTKVGDL